MQYFSNTWLIIVVAVCGFLIVAKLLKVLKGAAVFGLVVMILWLALYFTGYDETLYNIIFNAPPVQHESPFNR